MKLYREGKKKCRALAEAEMNTWILSVDFYSLQFWVILKSSSMSAGINGFSYGYTLLPFPCTHTSAKGSEHGARPEGQHGRKCTISILLTASRTVPCTALRVQSWPGGRAAPASTPCIEAWPQLGCSPSSCWAWRLGGYHLADTAAPAQELCLFDPQRSSVGPCTLT